MRQRLTQFIKDHFIRRHRLNSTAMVLWSFGIIILVGALLLTLPVASSTGESRGFFTALFTATSATCVTGLVVADTAMSWSLFGQIVILCMIQLGGLGFMTVITLVSLAARQRIGLSQRLMISSTLNLDDLGGVVRVVRHALFGTAFFELGGAMLLSVRMIPRFGLLEGLWHALFHSVSAFCNAGFDLQGLDTGAFSSLTAFQDDPLVLLTTAALVIIGGLGFFVWEDIVSARCWKKLTLYSKLVLGLTGCLLLGGAVFFFITEGENPATLGGMSLGEKWLNAFFQSMTLRTAGFNAIDQGAMTDASLAMSCLFMLIGGSSGSTAGGMKTVTMWVLIMSMLANLRGRDRIVFRGRSVSPRRVINAITLFMMVLFLFFTGSVLITMTHSVPFLYAAFETASALGTVGLTAGITPTLIWPVKCLIIVLMYIGRVGVLSFSFAYLTHSGGESKIKYPEFNIMIG